MMAEYSLFHYCAMQIQETAYLLAVQTISVGMENTEQSDMVGTCHVCIYILFVCVCAFCTRGQPYSILYINNLNTIYK